MTLYDRLVELAILEDEDKKATDEWIHIDQIYAARLTSLRRHLKRVPETFTSPLFAIFFLAEEGIFFPNEFIDPKKLNRWLLTEAGDVGRYIQICLEITDLHFSLGNAESSCTWGLVDEVDTLIQQEHNI